MVPTLMPFTCHLSQAFCYQYWDYFLFQFYINICYLPKKHHPLIGWIYFRENEPLTDNILTEGFEYIESCNIFLLNILTYSKRLVLLIDCLLWDLRGIGRGRREIYIYTKFIYMYVNILLVMLWATFLTLLEERIGQFLSSYDGVLQYLPTKVARPVLYCHLITNMSGIWEAICSTMICIWSCLTTCHIEPMTVLCMLLNL